MQIAPEKAKKFTFSQDLSKSTTKHRLHPQLCAILNETYQVRQNNKEVKKLSGLSLKASAYFSSTIIC